MRNNYLISIHHFLYGFHSSNNKQVRAASRHLDTICSWRSLSSLLLILLVPLCSIVAQPLFSTVAQNQKATEIKLQEKTKYYTPQLAGSNPTVKPTIVRTGVQNIEEKSLEPKDNVNRSNSSLQITWPQLLAKVNASKMTSDVTIYTGALDQCAPQVVTNGSIIYVAFESYDTQSGTYPYGSIQIYQSTNNGSTWSFWYSLNSSLYHLYSPQIVLIGGAVVISYIRNGDLRTYRFDALINPDVPLPASSTNEYVVAHRMVSDVEQYPSNPWLYMAILFKRADGKNRVFFSFSPDTGRTWGVMSGSTYLNNYYDSLALSQTELGKASVGFDYGKSGLYLAYLGTGTNAGNICMLKSSSRGSTWGIETILPSEGLHSKVGPVVSAVGQRVVVVYQYDYSGTATDWKTSGTGGDFDINAVVSYDGGTSWNRRWVAGTAGNEILPWVTNDADSSFYVSYILNNKARISMAGNELAFSTPDSSSSANVSLDYFPSIFGSTVSGTKTAYTTWTGTSNGLDIFGAMSLLRIPPLTPSNLNATAASSSQINLSWTDNSSDETGFRVYWSIGTNTYYGDLNANVTSAQITGLTSSTTYNIYVAAYNANGFSNISNTVTVTTPASTIPTISSFTPTSGSIGTTVTIIGTNFSTTAANNIVYFGAVKAVVATASTTSLSVTVPTGATYKPISVTVNGLTAYTNAPFIVTFPSSQIINTSSFASKIDLTTGSFPHGVTICDVDGDGKPDLIVANSNDNTVSIFRNTSASGSITANSFAPKVDIATGSSPDFITTCDIDGDGKPDIIVTNVYSYTVSVLRNISSSGSIAFAPKVDFAATNPGAVVISDIDGDGKPDIIVANASNNTISVFKNISTSGSITTSSFAAKVDFTTGSNPSDIVAGDIDGDGKPDLVVANTYSNTVSVFRNTSIAGSITASSFASKVDFTVGSNPWGLTIGDLDGDGKLDIVVANYNSNTVSVLRNTSVSGSITTSSFASKVDFTTGTYPQEVAITDVDGDGKSDVVLINNNSNSISVFKNTSTSGSFTTSSLASKVDFTTGSAPTNGIAIGDIDGDGKPDIVITNSNSNTVSVFRNTASRADGLVAWYPFNGNANDSSGNGNNGTNNGATPTTDRFGNAGKAYSFNGASSFINVSGIGSFASSVVTYSAWVRINSSSPGGIIMRGTSSLYTIFGVWNNQVWIGGNNGTQTETQVGSVPINIWTHIVGVYNQGLATISIYINGQFVQTVSSGFTLDGTGYITLIGTNQNYASCNCNQWFNGSMDDIRIYNRAMSVSEIQALYMEGIPTITSFSPTSGPIGTTVTITGTNFSTTAANNIVYFGAVKAVVATASTTSLSVTVPLGATYQPITVTVNGLIAYSSKPFNVTFAGGGSITSSSFATKVDFTTGVQPYSIAIDDVDGDGKPDLATANIYSRTASVIRNIGMSGSVSFATKVDFTVGGVPRCVAFGDVDGDGKPDLAVVNYNSNTISIFRNTGTSGNVSFAAKLDLTTGQYPFTVAIGDIDGDGKPDLAVVNYGSNTVSVFRNTRYSWECLVCCEGGFYDRVIALECHHW